ncbi:MAG: hypothetical protein BWY59_01873 [Verrucomicrobia bacterium ADurb.Bin345]|nr:MAG: hypothetical protein BWY59_01873 [Verrucomicrobia bacterium ADurb.Bin345]
MSHGPSEKDFTTRSRSSLERTGMQSLTYAPYGAHYKRGKARGCALVVKPVRAVGFFNSLISVSSPFA